MDEDSRFKGIASHPHARRWLRRCYAKARRQRNVAKACQLRKQMRELGMEVRS